MGCARKVMRIACRRAMQIVTARNQKNLQPDPASPEAIRRRRASWVIPTVSATRMAPSVNRWAIRTPPKTAGQANMDRRPREPVPANRAETLRAMARRPETRTRTRAANPPRHLMMEGVAAAAAAVMGEAVRNRLLTQ